MSPYTPSLLRKLDLSTYLDDQYATAVAAVDHLDGESARDARMRTICNLHLTRFVRMLLDRKDRASMAVGLEVRVPFCDHRLVEYVFNYPGLGYLLYNSVQNTDYPLMQALFMLFTVAVLVALLICDFVIAWLDPRARSKS